MPRLRSTRSATSMLYPRTGRAAAAPPRSAVGRGGPSLGCYEGPGWLSHGKPGLGATQSGPAGRPWAARYVSTELIGLIECATAASARNARNVNVFAFQAHLQQALK